MKLSQFPKDKLHTLTDAQISAIVYGDWEDDGGKADVALLLGGHPAVCAERANAAAQLYRSGRVSYICLKQQPHRMMSKLFRESYNIRYR